MKLFEQIGRINRLHELIMHRRTGTPQQLAGRLNLSVAMVYKLMDDLRLRGVPIEFSRQLGSYQYTKPYRMSIHVDFHSLEGEDAVTSSGGCCIYNRDFNRPFPQFYDTEFASFQSL